MDTKENVIFGPPEVYVPGHLSFAHFCYDNLKLGGDNTAQICAETGQQVSCKAILQTSVNLAVSLKKLGLKHGDVVAISSENRFEFTTSAIAIMFCGAVLTPLNITSTKGELEHMLKLSKPRFIFYSPATKKQIEGSVKTLAFVERIIYYGDDKTNDNLLYTNLIAQFYDVNNFQVADVKAQEETVFIAYSSGTTGMPKGVMLTHLGVLLGTHHLRQAATGISSADPTKVPKVLSVLPWFHVYGLMSHFVFLTSSVTLVFMGRFTDDLFLKSIQEYKVSLTVLVLPVLVLLAKSSLVDVYDIGSLTEIWYGAAPTSKKLLQSIRDRIKVKYMRQSYGMTETTFSITFDALNLPSGTVGQLMPGIKAKVLDINTEKALGCNEPGHLCFKTPLLMKGYIGDPVATKNAIDGEGYIHSGDVGYYDESGSFYIIDRIKEIIKYKGFQVSPVELEAILHQHPGVQDAGVVGVPDETGGELPMAFIVRTPGSNVTEEEIVHFLDPKVSSHKRLRGGVQFIEEIPKSPAGKVLRRILRNNLKIKT